MLRLSSEATPSVLRSEVFIMFILERDIERCKAPLLIHLSSRYLFFVLTKMYCRWVLTVVSPVHRLSTAENAASLGVVDWDCNLLLL